MLETASSHTSGRKELIFVKRRRARWLKPQVLGGVTRLEVELAIFLVHNELVLADRDLDLANSGFCAASPHPENVEALQSGQCISCSMHRPRGWTYPT